MTPYANLFSPLQLRHLTLRNRVFSSGHGTGFGVGGVVGDRHIAYHRARAHGGLALIVTEATGIDDAPLRSYNIRNTSDAILPGYRRLADAVHDEGAGSRAGSHRWCCGCCSCAAGRHRCRWPR